MSIALHFIFRPFDKTTVGKWAATCLLTIFALASAKGDSANDAIDIGSGLKGSIEWAGAAMEVLQHEDSLKANVGDTLYQKVQFSLVPGLSTNGKNSATTINDFSFNLIGGSSFGTAKAEFGGLFNANKAALTGVQFVLGVNTVGEVQSGAQFAGLANISRGNVKGMQAGVYNRAGHVEGVQLGLFNLCDSINGAPLGLISYVRNGYHAAEIAFDETFRLNLAFHTGVRNFYNVIAAGTSQRQEGNNVSYIGYGIGSSPKLGENLSLNVQLTTNYLMHEVEAVFNLLNRMAFGLDYRLGGRVSVTGSFMLNGLLYDDVSSFPGYILPQRREPLSQASFGDNYSLHVYPGARLGVRVLW